MNEQEWLTSENPAAMLLALTDPNFRVSDRKLRLFACAYCRAKGVAPDIVDRLEQNGSDAFESDWRWAAAIIEVRTVEPGMLASLLREVVGNPYRPVPAPEVFPCLGWPRKSVWGIAADAISMAEAVYVERAFDRLPVLADALEDCGCDNEHMLRHLRGEELVPSPHMPRLGLWRPRRSPHVRGCWVLDLILGKE